MKNSLLKAFALTLLISTTTRPMTGVEGEDIQQQGTEQVDTTNTTNVDNIVVPGENNTTPTEEIPNLPTKSFADWETEQNNLGFFTKALRSIKGAPSKLWSGYKSFTTGDNWSSKTLNEETGDYENKTTFQNVLGKGKVVGAHGLVAAAIAGLAYWLLGEEEVVSEEQNSDVQTPVDQTAPVTETPVNNNANLKASMHAGLTLAERGEFKAVVGASETFNTALKEVAAGYKSGQANGAKFKAAYRAVTSTIVAIK